MKTKLEKRKKYLNYSVSEKNQGVYEYTQLIISWYSQKGDHIDLINYDYASN